MRLHWTVRSFFCDNSECSHVTFSEQVPSVACRYARKTNRLVQQQTGIAFEVGGEPGSRLSMSLRVPTSPDTLLRFIRINRGVSKKYYIKSINFCINFPKSLELKNRLSIMIR